MLRHRASKIISTCSFWMIIVLLNGCKGLARKPKFEMKKDDETSISLVHDEANTTIANQVHDPACCPSCEGGYRFFYRLATGDGEIVVICEECNVIWLHPDKLALEHGVGISLLEERFHVEDGQMLFDENKGADWATKEDIKGSRWQGKTNGILFWYE